MTRLQVNTDEMVRIWQSLQVIWGITRDSWKGADQDQFEREHIQEITQATNSYIASLRRLAESVQRILSEAP